MIVGEDAKPPLSELSHFGIPGMHWGRRKAQLPAANIPRQISATTQVGHAVRNHVGEEAARALLQKYGKTAIKFSGKAVVKGTRALTSGEFGPFEKHAVKGAAITFKLLGKSAKVGAKVGGKLALKGGKAYLKTAIALAKFGLRVR